MYSIDPAESTPAAVRKSPILAKPAVEPALIRLPLARPRSSQIAAGSPSC
jgi:hypothetical protein